MSLLSAARGALSNGLVACSPTSGFHHAGYESGYGYCTFNGLMVCALALKAEGKVSRVGDHQRLLGVSPLFALRAGRRQPLGFSFEQRTG